MMLALIMLALPLASCGNKEYGNILRVTVDGGNGEKVYEVSYDLYRTVFLYSLLQHRKGHP